MTKLFQNIDTFESLTIAAPVKRDSSLTAKIHFEPIQFGEIENPICVVEEVIRKHKARAMRLSMDKIATVWIERLEQEVKHAMVEESAEWFGKRFTMGTIDRMHCSSLVNDEIIVRCTKDMTSFKYNHDDGTLKRVELQEIKEGDLVVPILLLEGLFIGPKHFTPSFTISNILSVGKIESDTAHPFSEVGRTEEIIDPFSFYTRGETDSNGSFDTHIFQTD